MAWLECFGNLPKLKWLVQDEEDLWKASVDTADLTEIREAIAFFKRVQ
mgnify:CR=1 FL=1